MYNSVKVAKMQPIIARMNQQDANCYLPAEVVGGVVEWVSSDTEGHVEPGGLVLPSKISPHQAGGGKLGYRDRR